MEEIWKAIPGHPGYEASTLGRIRSVDRIVEYKNGGSHFHIGVLLKMLPTSNGYFQVRLNLQKQFLVHRLVLITFVGDPAYKNDACHCDGSRSNNRIDNLRWDTRSGNFRDKIAHGTSQIGERHGMAKLTTAQVLAIRNDRRLLREISADYGISKSLVSQVRNRQIWTHI